MQLINQPLFSQSNQHIYAFDCVFIASVSLQL